MHSRLAYLLLSAFAVAIPAKNGAGAERPTFRASSAAASHRLAAEVRGAIGLADFQLVEFSDFSSVRAAGVARVPVRLRLPVGDEVLELDLEPASARAPHYKLLVQGDDGRLLEANPGLERTYRGSVVGEPESLVAASIDDLGVRARILRGSGEDAFLEPMPRGEAGTSARAGRHIAYRESDVVRGDATCTVLEAPEGQPGAAAASGTTSAITAGLNIAELAIDTDREYFEKRGTISATEGRVLDIINAMNPQYERDVLITHVVTRIIVRTAEPDPYNGICVSGSNGGNPCERESDCGGGGTCLFDAEALLNHVKSEWTNNQVAIPRDVVQMFTGKPLAGSTIGIAWPGGPTRQTICGSWGYSVVESDCTGSCGSFAAKTDLSAHELGHNWGAGHCSCSTAVDGGWTMNPTLTGTNRFHPEFTIPDIESYAATRNCLDLGDELRRVIVTPVSETVAVGEFVQLFATADFLFAEDLDVTTDVLWSIDPPDAGIILAGGIFVAGEVSGSTCVTVSAEFEFEGVTRTGTDMILVIDPETPFAFEASEPAMSAIDARIPTDPDGTNPQGWDRVIIRTSGDLCPPQKSEFSISAVGGGSAPAVSSVAEVGERIYEVVFSGPITPGTWTEVTHTPSGEVTRLGFLPGDVNGDGTSGPVDITALIDALNGVGEERPIWSVDIDRAGGLGPPDITTLIDLLNGANAFDAWNAVSLPNP